MGCLLAQAVMASGASQVDITDVMPSRLNIAQTLGIHHAILSADLAQHTQTHAASGYDIVVDATGVPSVIQQTPNYARPRGKIWIFGVAPDTATISFSPYEIFRKDLSIIGSFAVNRTFHESIMLIQSGQIQLEPLISHQLPLSDFDEGLRIAQEDPTRMKVQFTFP